MIALILQSLRQHKLSQDIAYTLASFAVLALSGIIINIAIAGFRDAAALGIFNIAYAVYIMMSQFAVWGLHYSVLRHASYHEKDPAECGKLLVTAAICSLATGILAATLIHSAEPLFSRVFHYEVTGRAIAIAAIGLTLFPLNKILLAYLNGLRRMRAFSILQGLRYVVVMAIVIFVAGSDWPVENTTWCFIVAEITTALFAGGYIIKQHLAAKPRFTPEWVSRHYVFGSKALLAGMFTEINSRADVLLIGLFLNPYATGIYSFAAMLVDGLYHVLAMVRTNFNPVLVSALRDHNWAEAQTLRTQSRKYILPITAFLALGLIAVYYIFAAFIMPEKGLLAGLPSLIILLTGLVGVSFLVPFDNLMMVSGHPGYQTFQQVTAVGANIVVAVALLPSLGIEGAALGTAISYVTSIAMLVYFSRRLVGWSLLANTVK